MRLGKHCTVDQQTLGIQLDYSGGRLVGNVDDVARVPLSMRVLPSAFQGGGVPSGRFLGPVSKGQSEVRTLDPSLEQVTKKGGIVAATRGSHL